MEGYAVDASQIEAGVKFLDLILFYPQNRGRIAVFIQLCAEIRGVFLLGEQKGLIVKGGFIALRVGQDVMVKKCSSF